MRALFMTGLTSLFLELLLIRFMCTEIYVLSILPNLVLIACFLGLGLGAWTCRERASVRRVLLLLSLLLGLYALPLGRSGLNSLNSLGFLVNKPGAWAVLIKSPEALLKILASHLMFYLLLALVVAIFLPLGRLVGRLLQEHPNTLRAYSANVLGSLVGIWCFAALGVASQPPAVWTAVAAVLLVWLARLLGDRSPVNLVLALSLVGLMLIAQRESRVVEEVWSPYQRVALTIPGPGEPGDYIITINGRTGYQGMLNLRPDYVKAHPELFPPELAGLSQYDLPALLHPNPGKALVIGAGSGNDVAGLLRNGVEQVTAVDIDPDIVRLGAQYHPESPYRDPRVRTVIDDARSFLSTTSERFDLVVFGLLDSHAGAAGTTYRLDTYVYTLQSLAKARRVLAPDGVLVLSFEPAFGNYVLDRLAMTLKQVFGENVFYFRVPASNYGWGGVLFVASDNLEPIISVIKSKPRLATQLAEWGRSFAIRPGEVDKVATDDWPYLYLRTPRIPDLYWTLLGMPVLMLAMLGWRRSLALLRGWRRAHTHFALLGSAFMLLETQNVSKAALLFGNTWLVNGVVITGVMLLILTANLLAERFPRLPLSPIYLALWICCVALYFVDLTPFAALPYGLKVITVGLIVSFPMLFSGIVFIRSFDSVTDKDHALGANLLGAMFGGALQMLTFLLGFKALLLVVAVLYVLAFPFRPSQA